MSPNVGYMSNRSNPDKNRTEYQRKNHCPQRRGLMKPLSSTPPPQFFFANSMCNCLSPNRCPIDPNESISHFSQDKTIFPSPIKLNEKYNNDYQALSIAFFISTPSCKMLSSYRNRPITRFSGRAGFQSKVPASAVIRQSVILAIGSPLERSSQLLPCSSKPKKKDLRNH
jgi:hypothetical protein